MLHLLRYFAAAVYLYVVPTSYLRNVSTLWLPADGKYPGHPYVKPKRDWTVYEGAWHLLRREQRRTQNRRDMTDRRVVTQFDG